MTEFDLFAEAGAEAGSYSLLAVSAEGVARAKATIPPSGSEFQQLLTRVSGKEKGASIRKTFGELLFACVFRGDILAAWAKATKSDDVRLRLFFDPPASNLPWELLHDGRNFLATSTSLAVSRYIPVPEPRGRPVADRLKVLLASASPGPLPPIPTEEIDQVVEAIGGEVELTDLRNCTFPLLADALGTGEYHVVHYLGHGAPGMLLLNGKTGDEVAPLADDALAQLLLGRPTIRLVLLSACSSAQTEGSEFAGVGPALIRTGVPAVIAMQYQFVQLSTAQIFNRQLYKELAAGTPVDVAVNRSRNRISATDDLLEQRDWSTPVLYLGTRNGRLITFRSEQASAVEKASQAVQAAVLNNRAGADAWRELKEIFESTRASYKVLAVLIELHGLVGDTKEQFDVIVGIAKAAIAGNEFNKIKEEWERMEGDVLADLKQASEEFDDKAIKDEISKVFRQAQKIRRALDDVSLVKLGDEIQAMRKILIALNAMLAARVNSAIDDLVSTSERTLGRIAAED